ncbi:hypothetical protein [Paenibacillus sp. SN-8-1]|uniref:hypothetical protein n=1 Tax=Paenibacillus sp. SN-8-1 TaxID=3435409 RepID=UPI003D9A7824
MRKYILLSSVVVLIVVMLFYFGIATNHKNLNEVKLVMVEHLIKKGYSKGAFDVEVKYHWENKLFGYNPYNISVTYKDEQDVKYFYDYNDKSNTVRPDGIGPIRGKEDKNFKHAE